MAGRASGVRAGVGTTLSAVTSLLPSERRKGERQGRLRLGRSGRAEVRMRETPLGILGLNSSFLTTLRLPMLSKRVGSMTCTLRKWMPPSLQASGTP